MASLCLEEPAADVAELEGSAKARRRSKVILEHARARGVPVVCLSAYFA